MASDCVVASASTRASSPRWTMSPRSAPACWTVVTISCEALMTVARSRPSTKAVVVALGWIISADPGQLDA
jgi:hypothetical protein